MKRGFALLALGCVAASCAAATRTAVEFYHPGFDHYFVTAEAAETAWLAAGGLPPWVPTGQAFDVWTPDTPGTVPVCRFFSATFAPLSSHFYSHAPAECAGLAQRGVWTLESADAVRVLAPRDGVCPVGTTPLYRLYNGGMGGAPNHRYTTSRTIRDEMRVQRWIPEGDGADAVFACVLAATPAASTGAQQAILANAGTMLHVLTDARMPARRLVDFVGVTLDAIAVPGSACPAVSSTPPFEPTGALPPALRIDATFGQGCTSASPALSGLVAGAMSIDARDVAATAGRLAGTLTFGFVDLSLDGVRIADGSVESTLDLVLAGGSPASGIVTTRYARYSSPVLTIDGSETNVVTGPATSRSTVQLTVAPDSLEVRLAFDATVQPDGSIVLNGTSGNSIGGYVVQFLGLVVNPDLCAGRATGGSLTFRKDGETGTITFYRNCDCTYQGP